MIGAVITGYVTETDWIEEILGEYDFTQVNEWLDRILPQEGIRIEDVMDGLFQGEFPMHPMDIVTMAIDSIVREWADRKELFCVILICGLLTAICRNISGLYDNKQIMSMGTYLIQALLGSYLMIAFRDITTIVNTTLGNLTGFLHILLPAYFVTTGVAVGPGTATGLYEIELVVMYLIEILIQLFLIPMVGAAMFLSVMSGITGNESMKHILSLQNKLFSYILKVSMALIGGFGVMQGLFAPVLDGVSYGAAQKILAAVPGMGGITDATMQMISGSLLLIKNSIGIAALFLIILICIIPMGRVLSIVLLMRIGGALIGLITDAGPVTLLERTGNCCMQMFRLIAAAFLLNFMMIAIVASCRIV